MNVDELRAQLSSPWRKLEPLEATLASVGLLIFALVMVRSDGFVPVLDHANLAFHEFGHPFFGILGPTLGLYGGTLGQLVFPVVTTASFVWQRRPVAATVTAVWFFENFLNIARYAADARAQVLPLVGGGEHDWWNILTRWNALEHDVGFARLLRLFAWAGFAAAWAFLLYRARADARNA